VGRIPVEKDNIVSDLHRTSQTKRVGSVQSRDNTKEKVSELKSEEARMTAAGENERGDSPIHPQSVADKQN